MNTLNVSMIVIGDEILNGRTADLNAKFLAKFLFKKGLNLRAVHFIRDVESEIITTLKKCISDSDVIITSGGIGPTIDDKTKKTLSHFFCKNIVERDDVADIVTKNYERYGRAWNKNTNFYHLFPEDFIAINNPKGLAPGLGYFENEKLILSAPGVPKEFSEMVEKEFFSLIANYFQNKISTNFQTVIRTKNIPEEKIFYELCPNLWEQLSTFGKVSSLPHTLGIDIVVSYIGNEQSYNETNHKIIDLIKSTKLSSYVWQFGNESVAQLVLKTAIEKKITFSFAESCTGGLASSKITDLEGSSHAFLGSIVSYDNSIKINQLNVKEETLKKYGAVSIETAKEMAKGARENLKTDFAVSITGIAGLTGGSEDKPNGTVCIAVSSKDQLSAEKFIFPGDRERRKDRFSDMALLMLYEAMSK